MARQVCFHGNTFVTFEGGQSVGAESPMRIAELEGKSDHTNDDSKPAERKKNPKNVSLFYPLLPPPKLKIWQQHGYFLGTAFCRHNIPNDLMRMLQAK